MGLLLRMVGPDLRAYMMMQHELMPWVPKYVLLPCITLLDALGIVHRIYLGVGVYQIRHELHLPYFKTRGHNLKSL